MNTSILLSTNEIIDRVDDIGEIVENAKMEKKSHVHVIYALSGLGKSSMSIKLMQEPYFDSWNVISITTRPLNVDDQSSTTLFFEYVWEGISSYFRTTKQSHLQFETYIRQGQSNQINKKTANEAIDKTIQINFMEGLLFALRDSTKQKLGLGDYNADEISIGNSVYEQNIKREYIRYVLSKTKILLIVDNLQNIDAQSLRYFTGWLADSKNIGHCFLFEYTLSDKHKTEDVNRLCETFCRTGVKVIYSELKKLENCHIPELLERRLINKPSHISFNRSALEHYVNSNGNIRELLDYARGYKPHKSTEIISSTMANILGLSPEAKNILATLILMGGTLELKTFEQLWVEIIGEGSYTPYVQELEYWDIIYFDHFNKQLILAHASIRDQWRGNSEELNNIDLIIYHGLFNFYDKRFHNTTDSENKDEIWQILLRLHVQMNPAKIAELMDSFKQNFVAKLSAEVTWRYLSKLVENTKHHVVKLKNTYYDIIKICYESYLFEEGYYCIGLMESHLPLMENYYLLLQKLMYMSVLDMHKQAIELANKTIDNFPIDSRIRVNINLILMHCYISVSNKDKCFEIDRELRTIQKLKSLPEYPIYLRLSNIYLDTKKSAKMAKKSIVIFNKTGNQRQAAKSLITYSKQLATLGKHKHGLKYIQKAEHILSLEQFGIAYVYHNIAAFMMIDGDYSDQVRAYIELAEDLVLTPYDQLSVIINQLAWYHATKNYTMIDLLEYSIIELLKKEPDKYLHALIHYNLAIILNDANRIEEANHHLHIASNLKEHCVYVKLRLDDRTKVRDKALKSRLKQPCHITFLSYWHYDLPDDLFSDMQFPQNSD